MIIPTGNYKDLFEERKKGGGYLAGYPLNLRASQSHELKNYSYFVDLLNNKNTTNRDSALYIHIPFCDSICTFCCFTREIAKSDKVAKYLQVLESEMCKYAKSEYIKSSKFGAVYFGGGTPTVLSADQLGNLLSYVKSNFHLTKNAEITIEASTHNFNQRKMEIAIEKGANRTSFGIQTFNDAIRKQFNLQDSSRDVINTVKIAKEIGFDIVDIDLMYNLPNQTMKDWEIDLQNAIDLGVENISFFPLHIHPNTLLGKQIESGEIPHPQTKDVEIDMYLKAVEMLTNAGYKQQHISKFVLPNTDHKYNILRLGHHDCVVCGPMANGNIGNCVYKNTKSIEKYMNMVRDGNFPIADCVRLSKEDEMRRYMIRGLGLLKVDKREFKNLFGEYPEYIFPDIFEQLIKKGLILVSENEIKLTEIGKIWGYNVCASFCSKFGRVMNIHGDMVA
ncbi:MAG: radical SAM family heme chaperone HemW [Thermoplasmata archaeon]|nr:MAG: radical SAM family heme chaperone HemW [Thermoplasmata archaeon]